MAGRFFSSWPMWAKLCFILACAIVITVCLGCAKLGHTHWQLRRYAAIAEQEKKDQAVHRQMSVRSQRRGHANDVPFGIRAIESGIEVEGVWISRSNTPEPVSRESSASTATWVYFPRRDPIPDLERQSFTGDSGRLPTESTLVASRHSTSILDHATSADCFPSNRTSRESSPDSHVARPLKCRLPPPALAKYSNAFDLPQQNVTASTIEGIEAIYRASGPIFTRRNSFEIGDDSADSSGRSTNSGELIAAAAPGLLITQTHRPRNTSLELDLMASHRMSQAAEMGQLAPRTRKPGSSDEWASSARAALAKVAHQPVQSSSQQRRRSSSPRKQASPGASPNDPSWDSHVTGSSLLVRRSSMPEVTPFVQFCQTAPVSPRLEPSRRSSGESDSRSSLANSFVSFGEFADPGSTAASVQLATSFPPQSEPTRRSFEKRKSDILRGAGSGFEILLPGSLNPPTYTEEVSETEQKGPPVSLRNYGPRTRSRSSESRRRLQKRRPSSENSRSSGDSGRRSVLF